MALSSLRVKHAGPGRHADLHGLSLLVRESGTRSWVLRMQHAGQRLDFGLGLHTTFPCPRRASLPQTCGRLLGRVTVPANDGELTVGSAVDGYVALRDAPAGPVASSTPTLITR